MDKTHFDVITKTFIRLPSRRDVLRGLAGAGLGLVAPRTPDTSEAKKKGKNKKKAKKKQKRPQLVFNAFSCLDVGQPCRGDSSLCCSGICEGVAPKKGKPDTSLCVAHNSGVCSARTDSCTVEAVVSCNSSNTSCICTLTTGNAGFCGDFTGGFEGSCRVCSKDTDCEAEFGPGAACLVLGGICTPNCVITGTTACVPPCA